MRFFVLLSLALVSTLSMASSDCLNVSGEYVGQINNDDRIITVKQYGCTKFLIHHKAPGTRNFIPFTLSIKANSEKVCAQYIQRQCAEYAESSFTDGILNMQFQDVKGEPGRLEWMKFEGETLFVTMLPRSGSYYQDVPFKKIK